ncbi:hypothetical protein ACFY4C_17105 [Actinomadura viridis]|uniref:hypothetical protein n=1 Tax=Actinomadura viridis TaxID=58110 RepID=UPI0036AFF5A7
MARSTLMTACVLGAAASLLLAGCGGGDGGDARGGTSPSAAGSPAPASSAGPRPTAGDTAPGGGGEEITLKLPEGWKRVDPLQDTSEVVQTSFGLTGETGPLVRSLMRQQAAQGVVFAIDTSRASGVAPHLQAGCDRGGAIGASLEQLKRKQQALEPTSKITDMKVGGRPGFKAVYESEKRTGPVSGLTVRVPVAADRFCYLDIEAEKGALPPEADRIAASFGPR